MTWLQRAVLSVIVVLLVIIETYPTLKIVAEVTVKP